MRKDDGNESNPDIRSCHQIALSSYCCVTALVYDKTSPSWLLQLCYEKKQE